VLNGKVNQEQLSPALKLHGVSVIPLHEVLQDDILGPEVLRWISPEQPTANNAFELLNLSFQFGGFFLDIPKNLTLDKPIEIHYLHDSTEVSFSHPSYFIRVGTGSSLTILERFERNASPTASTAKGFINLSGFIELEKNSSLTHIRWQDLPEAQSLVYRLSVTQERDSRFDGYGFDFGGDLIRHTINVDLIESNTYTSLQAGYMVSKKQSIDHQTSIHHKVPHCESHERFRGIIDEQASAAFNGKVFVYPDAQKTNAYQQNDTLVLSPFAVMNSKPQLEIFADDVKCSHGATIGQLDAKALFYLKTRGIDTSTAQHILKAAFLAQVLDHAPLAPLRDYIRSRMSLDL
jgi:Fe-S cluster assembly protein SufD